MENNELKHFGVLGMKWGRRKGPSTSSSPKPKRRFDIKSLSTNMDGRKTNKLFGKRNRTAIGKGIVNALMTPAFSKTKWTDMDSSQKKKTLLIAGAAITAISALSLSQLQ